MQTLFFLEWPTFPAHFSFEHLRTDRDKEAECVLVYERADYQEWNSYSFCNRGNYYFNYF